MKKCFLLIALFALMFLGLGNYSFAATCSEQDNAWTTISSTESCPTGSTPDGMDDDGNICCNPEPSGVAGAECMPPKGGKENSFGTCSCPDGTKDVRGVCKDCTLPSVCCGVELNTDVPFIGKCLEDQKYAGTDPTVVSEEDAFPVLMGSLTQILVTVILIISFVLIVIGGIMISTGNPKGGKDLIMKVVIGIALLGASGVILRLINPNFFG